VLPSGEKPGGAPMNVAYHLQKLGMNPAVISKIGDDERGRRLMNLLTNQQVCVDYIQKDEEHATGIVNATIQPNNEVTYEIIHPVAWDFIEHEERLAGLIQQAHFFVFGSLITRHQKSRETLFQLLELAKNKVLDINLRPPHFNQNTVETLMQKSTILKLNEHELPLISGWYKDLKEEVEQVQLLQDRFKLDTIVVTKGGEGALLNLAGKIYNHPGYKVTVADTVGSGDAFLAGFLSKTATGASPEDTLQFANGMGAFMASQSGACPPYELLQVQHLIAADTPLPA
jgi:fructokinase